MSGLSQALSAQRPDDALLDAFAVTAWLYQAGRPLRANPALQRLCGLDQAALCHAVHLLMVVPDDRAALAAATRDCLLGSGEPPAQPARLLTRSGSLRQVELTLRRVCCGGQDCALVTCVDYSDMHHVQSSLQAMSGLLRQIIDGAPVASFVIGTDHRVSHWNSACEQLTGVSRADMLGSTDAWRAFYPQRRPLLADLIVDGSDPAVLDALYAQQARPSALTAAAYEAEAFFPHLGPAGRWLYFTAAPLHNSDGQVIGAIETLQDVSQRRNAEEALVRHRNELEQRVQERSAALATSARDLEAFIENAPIGVVYTAQGRVLRSNRKMSAVFGLDDGCSAVGLPAADFHLSAEDYAELGRIAGPTLSQGQPLHHDMWMRHRSGRPIWMQLSAYVANHHDTAGGTWWMLQDRTEMRSARETLRERFEQLQATHRQLAETQDQLLQSDKMASIGQLAAGVAHEINNPVGFVSSNLNSLRQYVASLLGLVDAYATASADPANPVAAGLLAHLQAEVKLDYLKEDLPQLLDQSADGLARVKKIAQDLNDFSRVDPSDWQDADLNAGLQSTLNVVRHDVKYKADVLLQLGVLPPVRCLAGQLNQVFMNLIVNASQAIAERGVITLSSGTQGPWAWVQVDDNGKGMCDAVQRRIFEPFYTTKEVGKGTGLGLSLSFSIVQRHGGLIQLRSVPGSGSAFRVWVPIAGPQPASSNTPLAAPDWL